MKENLSKMLERGEKLEDLGDRAGRASLASFPGLVPRPPPQFLSLAVHGAKQSC